ncbi:response regulator transcription factor [Patescibacteria group bacterium]|nr:response regulator transcription factor [Patescibacteria group bacterium]
MKGLQYEGCLVDTAEDGETGLQKALTGGFDVVVADLLLPKKDGMEFVKEFRAQNKETPIIILSAIRDQDTKVKLLDLGADDYMEKPFSFGELLARIRVILRRVKCIEHTEIMQIGDLFVNPLTREVKRNGKFIKLRKKEFALLSYLISHQEEVLNHAIILENVWDFNAKAFSNTVGAHISSLRGKIDKDHKRKLIKTVHGVGYMFSIR